MAQDVTCETQITTSIGHEQNKTKGHAIDLYTDMRATEKMDEGIMKHHNFEN